VTPALDAASRSIVGRDAVTSLLTERFGLAPQLVHQAVDVMARRRPDLLGDEPRWFALGRGLVEDSAHIEPPPRVEVPDVLVSFATIGRAGAVRRLLATLADEVRESGYPGRVGVLVVENHEPQLAAVRDAPPGLTVHRVPVGELRGAVRRATRAGVLPALDTTLPLADWRSSGGAVGSHPRPLVRPAAWAAPPERAPHGGLDVGRRRSLPTARRGRRGASAHEPAVSRRALLAEPAAALGDHRHAHRGPACPRARQPQRAASRPDSERAAHATPGFDRSVGTFECPGARLRRLLRPERGSLARRRRGVAIRPPPRHAPDTRRGALPAARLAAALGRAAADPAPSHGMART
jgi:hypothetical protein